MRPAVPNRIPVRLIDERLAAEVGAISKRAPLCIALAYPSPYAVAMSSLGYQRVYRAIQETEGILRLAATELASAKMHPIYSFAVCSLCSSFLIFGAITNEQ